MTYFSGKTALVTGAGSGIGAALCRSLVTAGADVVCTDIDGESAQRTADAASGPGSARWAVLDVTDAAGVQAAVDEVVSRAGRLDLLFNNAGIVWGGQTELLTLEHWNAIVDINIRGVAHGVVAAYPVMVGQGHGHIVNTASTAGLVPAAELASYVMSKYAVVGLSLALRTEAAGHGVGILAICPGPVETPILEKGGVGDFAGRDYFLSGKIRKKAYDPDRLARATLRAIERNRALLVVPTQSKAAWLLARLAPNLAQRLFIRLIAQQRKRRGIISGGHSSTSAGDGQSGAHWRPTSVEKS